MRERDIPWSLPLRRGWASAAALCLGCNLVFGTEGIGTESDGATDGATAGTGEPGAPCVLTPKSAFNTGAPEAAVSALLAVDDDPQGSVLVAGTTTKELNLGGACGTLMESERAGFVARFSVDGECLDAATLAASGGFTLLAADYNASLGGVVVGGNRGGDPYVLKGALDDLSGLAIVDPPFEVSGLVRAVKLRDDDTIIATGECYGVGALTVDGDDVNCVVYPNTILIASGIVENDAGIFIAGGYSSATDETLPQANVGEEGVFIARLTGADLAIKRVEGLSGAFPVDNWYRTSVSLAGAGDTLAIGATEAGLLKIVELDAATLTPGADKTFDTGCETIFASDLIATPGGGWAIAGGAGQNASPGCRALGIWGGAESIVDLPLANPTTEGPRPRIAAGCFGVAAATASPSTLYLEYTTP
ncbi:MAG: hypothetical protein R3A79_20985 [Nannocystaceae bacterium]